MTDYSVVPAPNYSAPIVDLFGNNKQNNNQQGQQKSQSPNFVQALQQFLQTGQGPLAPGSAVPGAVGPTSVGGANGPAPLMASGGSPMINSNGMGFY